MVSRKYRVPAHDLEQRPEDDVGVVLPFGLLLPAGLPREVRLEVLSGAQEDLGVLPRYSLQRTVFSPVCIRQSTDDNWSAVLKVVF